RSDAFYTLCESEASGVWHSGRTAAQLDRPTSGENEWRSAGLRHGCSGQGRCKAPCRRPAFRWDCGRRAQGGKTFYSTQFPDTVGSMIHVGIGYDVHRLVEGRKLILGGVDLHHTKGLEGHSDADVLM